MAPISPLSNPLVQTAARARDVLTPEAWRQTLAYVCGHRNADRGFPGPAEGDPDRRPPSDFYYSLFGLMILAADRQPPRVLEQSRSFLEAPPPGGLDRVHEVARLLSLALLGDVPADCSLRRGREAVGDSTYELFLAALLERVVGAARRRPLLSRVPVASSLARLQRKEGGYGNAPSDAGPVASATAAALMLRHWLAMPVDAAAVDWLLSACRTDCGFRNSPHSPQADLLSTAVSLYALCSLQRATAELCLDCVTFAEQCRRSNGGFAAHPLVGATDCEYCFYALLLAGSCAAV